MIDGAVLLIVDSIGYRYLEKTKLKDSLTIPAWRATKLVFNNQDNVESLIGIDKEIMSSDHYGTTKNWRFASDRTVADLGDYLIHRLGIQEYLKYLNAGRKVTAKFKWGSKSKTNNQPPDVIDSSRIVTSLDIIQILQKCDLYEKGRMLQQLLDMNLTLPIYFNCPEKGINEHYFETVAVRYVTAKLDVKQGGERTRKSVHLFHDVDLPRAIFVSFGDRNKTKSLIKNTFEAVSEEKINEDWGKFTSIGVSVKSVKEKLLDGLELPEERRNWMILHLNGKEVFDKTEEENSCISNFFKSCDVVFVEMNGSDKKFMELKMNQLRNHIIPDSLDQLFLWKVNDEENYIDAENMELNGSIEFISENLVQEVLCSDNILLKAHKDPLHHQGFAKHADPTLALISQIKSTISNFLEKGKSFRDELELSRLIREEKQLLRDEKIVNYNSEQKLQRNTSSVFKLHEIKQKRIEVSKKQSKLVNLLIQLLKQKTREKRLIGCLELSNMLAESNEKQFSNKINRIADLENKINSKEKMHNLSSNQQDQAQWKNEIDALRLTLNEEKAALNDVQTAMVHVWRELGYKYKANSGIKGIFKTLFDF